MKEIINFLAYSWKRLFFSLGLFAIVWLSFSFYFHHKNLNQSINEKSVLNATKIYRSLVAKPDIIMLRNVLWHIKGSIVKNLKLVVERSNYHNPLIIGDPSEARFDYKFSKPLSYHGKQFGEIRYTINYLDLFTNTLLNNVYILLAFLIFGLAIIVISNLGIGKLLFEFKMNINKLEKALDENDPNQLRSLIDKGRPTYSKQTEIDIKFLDVIEQYHRIFTKMLDLESKMKNAEKNKAIARTTQTLAHDIRKPFSLLELTLNQINMAATFGEVKHIAESALPTVKKSLKEVNGMIDDIMECGRTAIPITAPNSLISIIEIAISDLFQIYQNTDIKINYDFSHAKMVNVEPLKLLRVLSNILTNAVQAMEMKGEIYIASRSVVIKNHLPMVQVTLGNSGKPIPEEKLRDLFEPFYTEGKEGGTGLGLAISKKIVNAHGGEIWCSSPGQDYAVEFHFTLPSCEKNEINTSAKLPKKSGEIGRHTDGFKFKGGENGNDIISDKREAEIERAIIAAYEARNKPFKVAIVDDEPIYREAFVDLLKDKPDMQSAIDIHLFSGSREILTDDAFNGFEYLICDIDMGPSSLNGFKLTKLLRKKGYKGQICIHSNRSLPEDYSKALEMGANTFFPKPMSQAHLLKLVYDALKMKKSLIKSSRTTSRPKVALLDDNRFLSDGIARYLGDLRVLQFETPEEFLTAFESNKDFNSELFAIITDNCFGKLSPITGVQLGKMMKEKYKFRGKIILLSNGEFYEDELVGCIDQFFPKDIDSYHNINTLIAREYDSGIKPSADTANDGEASVIPKNGGDPDLNTPLDLERGDIIPEPKTSPEKEQLVEVIRKRLPFNKLSKAEKEIFWRIRHDIRGHLSPLQIFLDKIPDLDKIGILDGIDIALTCTGNIFPYLPLEKRRAIDNQLLTAKKLIAGQNSADTESLTMVKSAIKWLVDYHFKEDSYWQSDQEYNCQKEPKDADIWQSKASNNAIIYLNDKTREKKVTDVIKANWKIVSNDIESLNKYTLLYTDNIDYITRAMFQGAKVISINKQMSNETIIEKIDQSLTANLMDQRYV